VAGAIDLFAGINPIAGANLFTVNKNPLIQIDQGVEDVIGQQAQHVGFDISQLIQALINQILGMGLKFLEDLFGSFPKGTLDDIALFFGNLLKFLGELDPLSPTFNPVAAAHDFLNLVLLPTHLIAPLVEDATAGLGFPGFVPMENLAVDEIGTIIGTAQEVIDAILATVGWVAGAGTAADLQRYFTDFLAMFDNPALTGGTFNASTAVGNFITAMVQPHNLLAPMNPSTLLISATNIPGLDASKIISGAFNQVQIPALTGTWGKTIAASLVSGALVNATLAAAALTAGAIPAGVTIAGSALTSAISAANVPALDATKITSGVFALAQIPTGSLGSANIADLQTVIDGIYQAMHGGTTTGNLASTVKPSLLNIPGANIITAIAASIVPALDASKVTTGVFTTGLIPNLPASIITSGTLAAAQIPGLDATKIISGTFANAMSPGLLPQALWQAGATGAKNLVISPNFEDATIARTFASFAGTGASGGYSTAVARSGTQCYAVVTDNNTTGSQAEVFYLSPTTVGGEATQNEQSAIKVQPGQWVYSEIYVRAAATNTTTTGSVRIGTYLKDSTGVNSLTTPAISNIVAMSGLSSSAWTKLSGWYQIPAGYDRIYPFAWMVGANVANQTFYWDDARIVEETWSQSIIQQLYGGASILSLILAAVVPGLDATKIISGVFSVPQIPSLPASIITSGLFAAAQIPGLDATKIISGTFANTMSPGLLPQALWQAGATGAKNLVISPQFEDSTIARTAVSYGSPATPATFGYSTAVARSGTQCYAVTTSSLTSGQNDVVFLSPTTVGGEPFTDAAALKVQQGQWIYTEIYVRAKATNTATAGTVSVSAYLKDSTGVNTQQFPALAASVAMSGLSSSAWTKLSGWYQIPAGYDRLYPFAWQVNANVAQQTFYWDDARIVEETWSQSVIQKLFGGTSILSSILASVIPGLDATKIISGLFAQAQIPALTSAWAGSVAASLVSGALTSATIAGSALTSAITAANVPALPAGWGKTVDGALIAGSVLSTSVIPPITPAMTTGLALIDDVTNAILATSIVGNTVAQMQYALANMPHINVQPLVGTVASDLGGSLQAHIDAGIQAITGSTASGNPLSLFQTAFGQFTNHVGVVTVNQPYVPPASVTAVSHANNSYIQQQSVNYEIAHAVDPTCNGPFDLSTIALAALSTVTVAQGTAVQCFDHISFGGIKQSVRWLGNPSAGASFTGFYLNIYRLDTTTGIETLVYASENIAAAVSASGTPVWKAYNIPSGAVQTLSLGTSATPPTGPGFPYTFPFTLGAGRSFTLTFSGQTTTAIPYPATAVSIQNALAALSNIGTGNVLVCDNGGDDFFITFAGTMAATTHPLITIDSTLLPNTTPTIADFIVATQGSMFAAEIVVVGTGNYNIVGITNNLPIHTTAIPARFGATRVVGSGGFTYAAATPWIGLASTSSTSAPDTPPLYVPPVFNPVLFGWATSIVIQNPAVTFPLANYFDVIIFGGGGGGAAGSSLSGSVGGYAAPHAVWSGIPRNLMGTAGLTVNVGGGGYGGGSTGAPGGNGAGSSVVIPGWTTLSVGGGAGNSGASSSLYGGPGQNESTATWSDAYYNPHGLAGGAGGQSPQAAGAVPGGGGAGGSATLIGANIYGGAGGGGAVYIYCYQ